MKKENISTLAKFNVDNQEYKPIKNAISEELQDVISKVYQLDSDTGRTLHFLTDIMMKYFHEDVKQVLQGELSPIEHALNGIRSNIEKTRLALFKDGYNDNRTADNPMWYLQLALFNFEHIEKLTKTEKLRHE